ncbi:hypothetical protein C9J12_08250 [Photobacterium frigidiphilum]|uniref:Uncharacterized protein n=1 Tax=Photobacterium frigidiphilum TaxID=264736 RepID=A0A2T3JKL0_9GAMM|nr:hypothetical protein [Photobacterium frigidiphilum]PSU49470.1 hypothetical protein C9J12_08250 [Photobacterium frigidiphilum]
MSLALITTVASMALELGPAVIRGVSGLFGGSETADTVADIVEKADGLFGANKDQKASAIQQELAKLPSESWVELERLKVELEKETTRRRQLAYEDTQANHHETQQTIRGGDAASDEVIRHTRPTIARRSFALSVLYIFAFEGLKVAGYGDGADAYMAAGIGVYAMAYFGLRTADGFAPYSKSSGDKIAGVLGSVIKGRK